MAKAPLFDLTGRTALVTGASSGIGARFARILAASGANVVLAARRLDRLTELRQRIIDAGGKAIAVAMDVAEEASVIKGYDAAEQAFGVVDTILANAGLTIEGRAIDLPIEDFDRIMAVNVRGVFLTAREGAKRLIASGSREKKNGRVIIISSITAKKVYREISPYASSKAAVLHMGKALAGDWARLGVNVNVILPGYIKTELTEDLFEGEIGARLISSFPRKRLLDEEALDAITLYLASDASEGVTGGEFTIDDGQSI